MLKFFRKTRQGLISDGNLKKYLLYAIGEILLVMIGILLALQVNNWNENRIDKKAESQYYQQIKRQINDDINILKGNMVYNQRYLKQFKFAIQIIEKNDRSKLDTLALLSRNLTRYSDFHRKSNIHETMVNSGEIKLLRNNEIIEKLQRLEEVYIYINQLEETHYEVIKLYMIPQITSTIKVNTMKIEKPDQIFTFEFQNNFTMSLELMNEKQEIYEQALNEMNSIIELIDIELLAKNIR